MTAQFTISCGLDTNGHDVDARQLVLDLAAEHFPQGHTIREVVGRWQCADGAVVTEPTLEVVWFASDEQVQKNEAHGRVARFAAAYKAGAFQEAVLIARQDLDCVFV